MIGRIIGNYEITGELAQGGMGAVYRGRHTGLPREVVVKAILLSSFPPQAQEMLKARFRREAYIQSQLDHPNIVRVYEFFTTEENYYLVMEFVNGMSIRDLLKRQGALAPDIAMPVIKQALAALDYAHNFSYVDESGARHQGIIHRDIKSANFLLDGMARLKLTDFGIVKLAGDKGLTRTGFNPGTAEYMSPEQIRGAEIDARSDLYSLGVVFYEMLAGRLPFPGSETGSEYEVLKGHMELAPPPLVELQPNVPEPLAAIVMHSLAKNPDDRFQSAGEFLEALLDYERRGAIGLSSQARPAVAERGVAAVPQVTHSMTEALDYSTPATPRDDLATNVINVSAQPAPPINRTTQPRPLTKPIEPDRAPRVPTQTSTSRIGLFIGGALIALIIIGVIAYFLVLRNSGSPAASASVTTSTPASTATPAAVEDSRLQRARDAEGQENYVEAINLYDDYLRNSPQAADRSSVSSRLEELKKLQGLLTVAELELKQQDFAAAQRDFAEALKLRPDSKRALTGLKQAEGELAHPR
jgi:serine/threonine-protein kinase